MRRLTREEINLKKQKRYTDSHGGPEVRLDAERRYFCLRCGTFLCEEGCSKLKCPECGTVFDWGKYIVKTPVL